MNTKIYVPSNGPEESWRPLHPEMHWKSGYSAKTLACCWEDAATTQSFPESFKKAIDSTGMNMEMLLAIPEYQVVLDTPKRPSQNDLFVLCSDANGLVVIMIEGKVSEKFDDYIRIWKIPTSGESSSGKESRLDFLLKKLETEGDVSLFDEIRYQLIHRTVSAILTAEKFFAQKAMMVVHSFSQTDEWFDDYTKFVKTLNPQITPKVNEMQKCKTLKSGIELWVGWVRGEEKFLNM